MTQRSDSEGTGDDRPSPDDPPPDDHSPADSEPEPRESPTPAERDEMLDAAVMRLLLVEHPAELTVADVVRELGEYGDAPGAVEDALRRLVGVALVHRHGEFVLPTRAALYFDQLPID